MKYSDPDHPIWGLVHYGITAFTIIVVLYITASQFDHTEINAWGNILTVLLPVEIARWIQLRWKSHKDSTSPNPPENNGDDNG